MGILQAATQINDPAVGFVPRLCTALITMWLLGGWIMGRLAAFFVSSVAAMVAR
jgi:flagellar biosynthesis protein FliQ